MRFLPFTAPTTTVTFPCALSLYSDGDNSEDDDDDEEDDEEDEEDMVPLVALAGECLGDVGRIACASALIG